MSSSTELPPKILEGRWDDNVSWEFYLTDRLPAAALCTAVFCLAIIEDTDQIVLARNKRGWEMLGGHIDPGEFIEEALIRESVEEGGFHPSKYMPFGYRKVMAKEPVVNDHHGGTYPPVAFIPHFLAITNAPLARPTAIGEEIFESRTFHEREIAELHIASEPLILAGLERYRALKAQGFTAQ